MREEVAVLRVRRAAYPTYAFAVFVEENSIGEPVFGPRGAVALDTVALLVGCAGVDREPDEFAAFEAPRYNAIPPSTPSRFKEIIVMCFSVVCAENALYAQYLSDRQLGG